MGARPDRWITGPSLADTVIKVTEDAGFVHRSRLSKGRWSRMAFVEDRWKYGGNENRRRWRARYRAPDGRERSKSFLRKADACRFAADGKQPC